MTEQQHNKFTVGYYLLQRLKEHNVDHIFGVPGDYAFSFFEMMVHPRSKITYIGTCNELNAATAADGYARMRGLGAVAVTCAVGEFNALNGIAGAYAENVPVIIITSSPTIDAFINQPLMHHTLGDYFAPQKIFSHITVDQAFIDSEKTAPQKIDSIIQSCLYHKKPVYINIPCDVVTRICTPPSAPIPKLEQDVDLIAMKNVTEKSINLLNNAKQPLIVVDAEIISNRLENKVLELLEISGFPFVTTMMGKTVIEETHPQFLGMYVGKNTPDWLKDRIEKSDGILYLGSMRTDFNTGDFTFNLPDENLIELRRQKIIIQKEKFKKIPIKNFIDSICKHLKTRKFEDLNVKHPNENFTYHKKSLKEKQESSKSLTTNSTFNQIANQIPENSVILADIGVSIFAMAQTLFPKNSKFISGGFYSSIGYTLGATLGVLAATHDEGRKVLLFVGDGAFQMTFQEISTMLKFGFNPVIFVINNFGYTIERTVINNVYNDLVDWKYSKTLEFFGDQHKDNGRLVLTQGELDGCLNWAFETKKNELCLLELQVPQMDLPKNMDKVGLGMRNRNKVTAQQ